jgi:tRNA-specific 2-thiouridylase
MRVLLGMSGGLDSAYSARCLLREGHEVEGAVLRMHEYTELDSARVSARELGIPLHEIDMTEQFRSIVIRNFAEEYRCGRTPNPCILCNECVKLRGLYEYARKNGFDRIATGHYARITRQNGRYSILRGLDPKKDQSYVLWRLDEGVLANLLLPLGEKRKDEVRSEARSASLSAADRAESRDICFIPDGDYAAFLESYFGGFPQGDFVDEEGKVLGRHRGIHRYTVGQRRGLGVALGQRMYVKAIEPKEARIVLAPAGEARVSELYLKSPVFTGMDPIGEGESILAEAVLRYQAKPVGAVIRAVGDRLHVTLSEPRHSVTAGQSAVFYRGDLLLFGGVICENE